MGAIHLSRSPSLEVLESTEYSFKIFLLGVISVAWAARGRCWFIWSKYKLYLER